MYFVGTIFFGTYSIRGSGARMLTSSASPGVLEGVYVETTVSEINIVFYDEYQRFGTNGEVDSIPRGVCSVFSGRNGVFMPASGRQEQCLLFAETAR